MATPVLLSWSGGKDCLMALARLRTDPHFQVVALLTTLARPFDRVSMHGIRHDVLRAQVAALGLPLLECTLDWPSSNAAYAAAMARTLAAAGARWPGIRHCAFGDLFLADVRAWREAQLARVGWTGVFPLWGSDTGMLANEFIGSGRRAVLTCVDTTQLDGRFGGRAFDARLLAELPPTVDPCGERGEFHTLAWDGPGFTRPLALRPGESVLRDARFRYADFMLADGAGPDARGEVA